MALSIVSTDVLVEVFAGIDGGIDIGSDTLQDPFVEI